MKPIAPRFAVTFTQVLACGACVFAAVPARAQTQAPELPSRLDEAGGPPLQLRAGLGLEHDSNVLRTPNATADQAVVATVGGRLDKRYSLQRLTLDVEGTHHRYRDLDGLDYTTLSYRGAWDLRLTPRFRALLSTEQRQWRDVLDVSSGGIRIDRRTERKQMVEGTFEASGGWLAQAGLTHTRIRSDESRALEASPDVSSARVGAGYAFGAGTVLMAQVRRGQGHYANALAGPDFRETEAALVLHWPGPEGSTADVSVGHLRRRHDGDATRDFSGPVASGRLGWQLTAKTRLEGGLARDLGSYEFNGGGHVSGWRVYLEPRWDITAKTSLRLRAQHETRDWHVASTASPDLGRNDTLDVAALTLQWQPQRPLTLVLSLRHERRDSSLAAYDFRARIVGLLARLDF